MEGAATRRTLCLTRSLSAIADKLKHGAAMYKYFTCRYQGAAAVRTPALTPSPYAIHRAVVQCKCFSHAGVRGATTRLTAPLTYPQLYNLFLTPGLIPTFDLIYFTCRYEGGCNQAYPASDLIHCRCYVCGRMGHLCCTKPPVVPVARMSCYYCGAEGHRGEDCPYESRPHLSAERQGDRAAQLRQ
ncbi:hypothetical protein DUNSADRAFT_17082 [Dunaliella salina]|uniref:CCHC-type domain-containing protein n=1 Tax=Dunaliella salina TaxID=3046 RepID=A0ABQ7G2F3_DUNSA|nr:hypothetical protein DUNSADRAFT_17082 [Dunaliella salina]|eukprot:KAF5828786.1 hypothetical protein DUNSADRAFT_17082 [Dunaliella salina]